MGGKRLLPEEKRDRGQAQTVPQEIPAIGGPLTRVVLLKQPRLKPRPRSQARASAATNAPVRASSSQVATRRCCRGNRVSVAWSSSAPEEGLLVCGDEGMGRLWAVDGIIERVTGLLAR
jgi:hypothetical protein